MSCAPTKLHTDDAAEGAQPRATMGQGPFYKLVPKGWQENLRFRLKVLRRCRTGSAFARAIWKACQQDLLFYVAVFVWTYDTRDKQAPRRPFIPWKYQEKALLEVAAAIGNWDLLIEKSRDMGASWMIIIVMEWFWHFYGHHDLLMVSRNEDYVDKRGNKKALMWKLDFIHELQPSWLLPGARRLGWNDPNRKAFHLRNPLTDSVIDGEATTAELGSGDRRSGALMDEVSKWPLAIASKAVTAMQDVTPCRIFNFTPRGRGNAAWEITRTDIRRLRMHWADHPIKRRGLYRFVTPERVQIIDRDWWTRRLIERGIEFAPDRLEEAAASTYDFTRVRWAGDPELPLRSPWFDYQCRRARTKADILQEQEIRYDAASDPFFSSADLAAHGKLYCGPPKRTGRLDYVENPLEPTGFIEGPSGPLRLWLELDATGWPPEDHDYVIGIDVATGSRDSAGRGKSNSAAVVFDKQTKQQVAEYVVHGMGPETFARRVVLLGRWFRGKHGLPKLIWEVNGPGATFGDGVMDEHYGPVYYRTDISKVAKKPTDRPGWHSNKTTKPQLLAEFRRAISPDGECVVRSQEILNECEAFEYTPEGGVEHSEARNEQDPSGARENHADRATAAALAWWLIRRRKKLDDSKPRRVPSECFYSRQKAAEHERARQVPQY